MVMAKSTLQISLVAIAICLCGIAIVSTVQIAIATYLLRSGITEGTVIANEALIIFSVSATPNPHSNSLAHVHHSQASA